MDILQTWIVIGIPGLLLAAVLLVGNSRLRALGGIGVLVATMLGFVLIAGEPLSAAAIGIGLVGLVASGRGQTDDELPEHHQHRKRFTVAER